MIFWHITDIEHGQQSSPRHGEIAPYDPKCLVLLIFNRDLFWHLGIYHRRKSLIRSKKRLFVGKVSGSVISN